MKRIFIGLAAGIAITVGTLCVLEGTGSALLFIKDYRNPNASSSLIRSHVAHDTLLGWTNKPGAASPDEFGKGVGLSTTALGFRGNGGADTAAGAARGGVMCSGDSYTQGYGVADDRTWCARLGAATSYNMGQAFYGLDQVALRYRRDAGRAPHTTHVLGISNAQLERMTAANVGGRLKPTVAVVNGKLVARDVPVPATTVETLRDASRSRTKFDLRMVQAYMHLTGIDPTARAAQRIDGQWTLVEQVLDDIAAASKEHGSRLVLAYLPLKRDLRPGPFDARREKLAAHAKQRGITFIDLTTPMRAMRPDSLDLAFISRVPRGAAPGMANQYSNLGHAWVAQRIAAQLGTAGQ